MSGIDALPEELLESVLQHLDMKTLLFAQQVSRRWKNMITSSPQIQEALFLRPKTTDIAQYSCTWEGDELINLRPLPNITTTKISPSPSSQTFTSIAINPLLINEIWYKPLDRSTEHPGQDLALPPLGAFLRHPTGSWKSMFLTQPPIADLTAISQHCIRRNIFKAELTSTEPNCTLGDLVDRMLEAGILPADSSAASQRIWYVEYVGTLEPEFLAVGGRVAEFVNGKLVRTAVKYDTLFASRKLIHPLPPCFGSWPDRVDA